MRNITEFSAHVLAKFENNYDNIVEFNQLATDASNGIFTKYSKSETDTIIRNQFDSVMGIDFKTATPMQRRQAFRLHGAENYSLIENIIADKMVSGYTAANAKFMEFVEDINIANGDKNEFYVNDTSLLIVSKFAGNHSSVIRQKVTPGKAFRVDTSWFVIKTYADYEAFQLGKIDFTEMIDRMYKSIEQHRYAALFTTFMSVDSNLPSDMKLETPISDTTVPIIVDKIEDVKAVTGKDVILVGTRTAIQKLQKTVSYDIFSDSMKNEKYEKGILAKWEGYDCLALDKINQPGTRTSVFTADDNKKIFILPVDSSFKPIKRVNEGDVIFTQTGMDGQGNMDMTITADIRYQEGIGVIIDQLFGEIIATD